MFELGNVVMHPSAGVCRIADIREEKFTEKKRMYYVLNPIEEMNRSTIYVPVDTEKVQLRKLLTKEEIETVIEKATQNEIEWITNPNFRKAEYTELLHSGDLSKVIALIVCLHKQKVKLFADGKKYPANDERILHEAERKIYQEFSHALKIKKEEIPQYIMNSMKRISNHSEQRLFCEEILCFIQEKA